MNGQVPLHRLPLLKLKGPQRQRHSLDSFPDLKTWGRCRALPMILELFPVPVAAYYSQNYSSIIGACLVPPSKSVGMLVKSTLSTFSGFSVGFRMNEARLFITNLSLENNLTDFQLNVTFWLNAHFRSDDDWSIQSKRQQVSSSWEQKTFASVSNWNILVCVAWSLKYHLLWQWQIV